METGQTKLEAYNWIRTKGILNSKQEEVFNYIMQNADVTDYDIAEGLGWSINCVTPRRNELLNKMIQRKTSIFKVVISGEKENPSGRNAEMYHVIRIH